VIGRFRFFCWPEIKKNTTHTLQEKINGNSLKFPDISENSRKFPALGACSWQMRHQQGGIKATKKSAINFYNKPTFFGSQMRF
jgi:hypothetical protein